MTEHPFTYSQDAVVLVVDDHPLVPMALRDLIEQRFTGVRCLQAGCVRQARGVYQDEPGLRATVLDLRLPDATGLEGLLALRRVRADVPVVVFTGLHSAPLWRTATALGAAAIVCKNQPAMALVNALVPYLPRTEGGGQAQSGVGLDDLIADHLSLRQQQIWQALADGLSNSEIAARYQISVNTAKAHVRQLLHRLGARSRTEAVSRYYRARSSLSG